MKKKRFLALMLVLSILFTFPVKTISETQAITDKISETPLNSGSQSLSDDVKQHSFRMLGAASETEYEINSPSNISYGARVKYKILKEGMAGFTDTDTQAAVVRFTLENPDDRTVTFNYTTVSGSVDTERHLTEILSGTVTLSKTELQKDVMI
ncbi:MAG: hypothetical protein GX625_05795, partial [Clostridiaceae bacterium]|nr:hypothetical protein [Clostridiaceae bacterium]